MNYKKFFNDSIKKLKQNNNYRYFNHIHHIKGKYPICEYTDKSGNTKDITIWCSNDYMAMGQNETVSQAMCETIKNTVTGAGGTRNISGSTVYHQELESTIKDWMQKESALVFTSGWVANFTILSTLGEKIPNCIIYSDAMNHNSIIEGIRRSRVEKRIFKHNDVKHLEELIKKDDINAPKIIVFESIYSMNGNIAPIEDIVKIAKKYNALTFLDEVHAVGLYGDNGAGIAESLGLIDEIDIIQGTLGKAVAQIGGFMASSKEIVDFVRSFGNGFIFTTSLPPVVAKGATQSILHLKGAKQERTQLQSIAKHIKETFVKQGIPIMYSDSHIIPVMVGDSKKCLDMSNMLIEKHNIYIQSINHPTVAKGTERLRISPSPAHNKDMVKKLSYAIKDAFENC